MDPDQHPRSLTRIHAVRLSTLLPVEKLIANRMDPDQTAQAGLDSCWSQTNDVGFVMTRLKFSFLLCLSLVISLSHRNKLIG
jgi:hypothetical protein